MGYGKPINGDFLLPNPSQAFVLALLTHKQNQPTRLKATYEDQWTELSRQESSSRTTPDDHSCLRILPSSSAKMVGCSI